MLSDNLLDKIGDCCASYFYDNKGRVSEIIKFYNTRDRHAIYDTVSSAEGSTTRNQEPIFSHIPMHRRVERTIP
jgi:hypothetical protein